MKYSSSQKIDGGGNLQHFVKRSGNAPESEFICRMANWLLVCVLSQSYLAPISSELGVLGAILQRNSSTFIQSLLVTILPPTSLVIAEATVMESISVPRYFAGHDAEP